MRTLVILAVVAHSLTSCIYEDVSLEGGLSSACKAALSSDFIDRDKLPQTDLSVFDWPVTDKTANDNIYGPYARAYPSVAAPPDCNSTTWLRARIATVAKKYIGLNYRHHHIPGWSPQATPGQEERGGPGFDCSNFTSWVYNYGIGFKFTSSAIAQGESLNAPGRRLEAAEAFETGDLLFMGNPVSHVIIYLDADHIIDSASSGVKVRSFSGWYKSDLNYARRIIE